MIKIVLITGASRGIGAATAVAFAKSGYNIIVNYNNSEDKAHDLCDVLESTYNVEAYPIKADVSNEEDVEEMVKLALDKFGKIDVLVNNAGVSLIKLITDTSFNEWNKVINTNLTSQFLVSNKVLPSMIKNHSGVIINVASMWGEVGASMEVAYSASKAGVIGFTKALAKEVGLSGIRVNCVSPGVILTDMNSELDDSTLKELKEETQINELGTPKDVADTICYLCSDKAKYITGQIIDVNGGIVI